MKKKNKAKILQTDAVEQHSPELSEYFMSFWIFLTFKFCSQHYKRSSKSVHMHRTLMLCSHMREPQSTCVF